MHCRECGCSALFSGAKEIGRVRGRLESEILEAGSINVTKDISVLSVHLSGRELSYLASSWSWELFYMFTPSKSILFVLYVHTLRHFILGALSPTKRSSLLDVICVKNKSYHF